MTCQIFHNAKKLHNYYIKQANKHHNELSADFADFKYIISATKTNKLK